MEAIATELLQRLAATSLQTALLVTLLWGLCRALPRLPASTQCWLWWAVALQAVLGLLATGLALPWLPAATPAPGVGAAAMTWPVAPEAPVLCWRYILLALWLAGVGVMLGRTALAWCVSRMRVRNAEPCTDASLVQALGLAAQAHNLRVAPSLRLSRQIHSPQLVGLLRPVLLLPAQDVVPISDDELDMAISHELIHLRRRDLWWGLLPALAQCLFFFHPLMHLALREYGLVREAAVDAAVIAGNPHCRGDYGHLLVRLGVCPQAGAGLASAASSFLSLKRRLLMMQNIDSFPRVGAALILVIVGIAGVIPLRLVAGVSPGLATQVQGSAGPVADSGHAQTVAAASPAASVPAQPRARRLSRVPPPPAPPPLAPSAAPAPPAPPLQPDPAAATVRVAPWEGSSHTGPGVAGDAHHDSATRGRLRAQPGQAEAINVQRAQAAANAATEDAVRAAAAAKASQIDGAAIQRQVDQTMLVVRRQGAQRKLVALAKRQAELARQQVQISRRAAKEAEAIIQRAIEQGLVGQTEG